jgi:hypothetical protein
MNSPDLERLRFLLRGLREPAPAEEAERQALAAFDRELGRKAQRPEERREPGPQDES